MERPRTMRPQLRRDSLGRMRPENPLDDTDHLPPPEILREIGNELLREYRANGWDLPADITPEQLARTVLDDMRRNLEDGRPEYRRIVQVVLAELGPTATQEQLMALLEKRLSEGLRDHPTNPGSGASA